MFMQLNDSRASKERGRGLAHAALPAELYAWMYPDGTSWDAPLMGEPREPAAVPGPEVVSLRGVSDLAPAVQEAGASPLPGSNNWAVSGALTATGRAMVANDMHLGLAVPTIYYRARLLLVGPDARDVSGVTLPGAPFVIAGSNRHIAWGYTNSYGDYTDAVLLQPGSGANTYRTPDGEREFDVHAEIIEAKGADAVVFPIRETIWGPVVDDAAYPGGEVVVSWIAHKPDAVNLNLIQLETARDVSAALDVANTLGMPPQNFVCGDAGGNIGWTIAGRLPARQGFDPQLPADWSAGAGWQGWVEPQDYPRVYNPDNHRIWTANARVADGSALDVIGDGGYDLGARARQIRDSLAASQTFTEPDMLAIQIDDRALFLVRWRELILSVLTDEAVAGDTTLQQYRDLVRNWLPRAAPESVGYRLVRAFRLDVRQRLFHALTAPVREQFGEAPLLTSNQFEAAVWSVVSQRPPHLLPAEHEDWDAFFMAAIRHNIDYLQSHYSGPLSARRWGEINAAEIRHPLSNVLPGASGFLDMRAVELPGDRNMPRAQATAFGAAERFVVSPGDEASGILHLPGGQSGHPLSDFYRGSYDDWAAGGATPFLPGPAQHTLTLVPATR